MSALESLALQLSTIDDGRLLAVVGQLERLRARDKVEPLIAPARPRLRELKPERRMTLQRLNCMPFEDLLVSNAGRTPAGRIAREAIVPSWRLIVEQTPKTFQLLERELLAGMPPDDVADKLWGHAAEALRQILDRSARDEVLRRQLRRDRPGIEYEMRTIYRYLTTAGEIQRFKRETGPAPLADIGEAELRRLREGLSRVTKTGGSALHLLMAAAARARDAERVMQVFVGGGEAISGLREEAATVIGGFLFGGIEQRMTMVAKIDDPRRLAESLGALLDKMESTEELLQRDHGRGTAEYAEEISAVSTMARQMVEGRLIPEARAAVQDILVRLESGKAQPGDAQAAEDHVRALRHSKTFAGKVGAGSAVALSLQTLSRQIEERGLQAVRNAVTLGQKNAGDEKAVTEARVAASLNLAGAARLLELSGTSAAAHRLYSAGLKLLAARP